MPAAVWAQGSGGLESASVAPWWVVGVGGLALGGVCGALGYLWAQRKSLRLLRQSRDNAWLLAAATPCWQWRTNTEHQVQQITGPGSASLGWAPNPLAAGSTTLWEWLDLRDQDAHQLRQHLGTEAPLREILVHVRSVAGQTNASPAPRLTLRAVPWHDTAGRFGGYLGTLEAHAPEPTGNGLGIQTLLAHSSDAIWLAARESADGPLLLKHASPAAIALMGLPATTRVAGLRWEKALAALPAELQPAMATLSPDQKLELGEHLLELVTIELGAKPALGTDDAARAPAALMLRLHTNSGAAAPGPQTPEAQSDHEAFSYTVSHDLRAPIRVVEGFTRILKEDYGRVLDRIGNDHLDRVQGAAARMNSMIDSLLALAQLSSQPLAKQPVNMTQLAGYIVDDLRRATPERAVDCNIQDGLMALGDPTLLRVMLENLLGNAWKYSGKAAKAHIRFETAVHGGETVFVVRDNGAGFDMRFADRLFGVFQRLHSANDFQGTGVGLASVRRIVRRHGGEIWAESEVGKGASFFFKLPTP